MSVPYAGRQTEVLPLKISKSLSEGLKVSKPPVMLREPDLRAGALTDWLSAVALPIELEIGSSRGDILCKMARENPGRRYIGIEIDRDKSASALQRAVYTGITNICFVNMEAHSCIGEYISSGSLSALHIYFPTPDQRSLGDPSLPYRLFSEAFVRELYRVLIADGSVRMMTDDRDYSSHMLKLFVPLLWRRGKFRRLPLGQSREFYVGTPLEKKYSRERLIYRYKFEKVETDKLHLVK